MQPLKDKNITISFNGDVAHIGIQSSRRANNDI